MSPIAWIDCAGGVAGDMLLAAALDAGLACTCTGGLFGAGRLTAPPTPAEPRGKAARFLCTGGLFGAGRLTAPRTPAAPRGKAARGLCTGGLFGAGRLTAPRTPAAPRGKAARGLRPAEFVLDVAARLRLPGVGVSWEAVRRGGFRGSLLRVEIDAAAHPEERSLAEVLDIVRGADLPARVVEISSAVFRRLAQAEAEAHGLAVEAAHLHEVGAVDAIVDVVGVVAALDALGVSRIACSALPIGTGTVHCRHGELPLPAPAVARLIRGLPVRGVQVEGETVTPTGAALVATLAERFGPMPAMRVAQVGIGAGATDRPGIANLTRLFVGEPLDDGREQVSMDEVLVETNLDDMTPDLFDHAIERLMEAGASDAFVTGIVMKKGRPAHKLSALVGRNKLDGVLAVLFRETTGIGCRIVQVEKRALDRTTIDVETPWGRVPVKLSTYRGEVVGRRPEHDACRRIAREAGVSLRRVVEAAVAAAEIGAAGRGTRGA